MKAGSNVHRQNQDCQYVAQVTHEKDQTHLKRTDQR